MTLVRSRGVTKKFGGLTAVNNVDFDIPRGSIVSLIGPNGAGKTTFFNMITGYYVPTAGEITFDDRPITTEAKGKVRSKKPHEVTAMGIGRTFQNIRLFGAMSVLDNVRVGLNVHLRQPLVGFGPAHAEDAPRGAGRDRRGDGPAEDSSISTSGPSGGRGTCRTATSAGWRSRGPSRPARSSCCSTNRPPA